MGENVDRLTAFIAGGLRDACDVLGASRTGPDRLSLARSLSRLAGRTLLGSQAMG